MAYNFTITDTHNLNEAEILSQANEIAKADITTLNLDPESKLKLVDLQTVNQTKVYTFSLQAEGQNQSTDNGVLDDKNQQSKANSGVAAASI